MKIKLALLTLTLLSGHLASTASAIVIAPGFETARPDAVSGVESTIPDPNGGTDMFGNPAMIRVLYPGGAPLSGLGSQAANFGALSDGTFAAWEKFSQGSFTNLAQQYSGNNGLLSATLTQTGSSVTVSSSSSNSGALVVGSETYYGRLMTGPFDFEIDATSFIAGGRVTLAIKHSSFNADLNATAFTATLNGLSFDQVIHGPNLGNSSDAHASFPTSYSYHFYQWDLDVAANDNLSLVFSAPGGFSIDSIALSVQPIPEPSTFVLLGAGLIGGLYLKRRKRSA